MTGHGTIRVWITKYALTQGVFELDVCPPNDEYPGQVCDSRNPLLTFHGKDWHRSKMSAMIRAEEMRRNKIKSIKKHLKNLESLVFITGGGK